MKNRIGVLLILLVTVCYSCKQETHEHIFSEWTIVKSATEESEGIQERYCEVCEFKEQQFIAKLEHTHKYSEDWSKDDNYHWHAAICGHEEQSEKEKHIFSEWTIVKSATEESEGIQERYCEVCEFKEQQFIAKLEHTHKYSEDWSKDDNYHWHAAICGHEEQSEKEEHSFNNWELSVIEDTTYKIRECNICGLRDEKTVLNIPKGFAFIPAGTFYMGSNYKESGVYNSDEKFVRKVILTNDFYMGKYEITQAEWEEVMGENPSWFSSNPVDNEIQENRPVEYITWYDAYAYCNKRSIKENLTPCYKIKDSTDPNDWGMIPSKSNLEWDKVICDWNANGYRLPTEAEWEYAARAGNLDSDLPIYSGTNDETLLGEYAWISSNSDKTTHEVGKKKPNAWNLYDMNGNVAEMCWNWYTTVIYYLEGQEGGTNPTGQNQTGDLTKRATRGDTFQSILEKVTDYSAQYPYSPTKYTGLRIVRNCN